MLQVGVTGGIVLYWTQNGEHKQHMNPLFPDSDEQQETSGTTPGYVLARSQGRHLHPPEHHTDDAHPGAEQAVDLIRNKINQLYTAEPAAKQELAEAADTPVARSKHQQFMHELSTSGKSLAQIQTAWHNYYVGLPDDEKHLVWQEFYSANARHPSAYTKFVQEHARRELTPTEAAQPHPIEAASAKPSVQGPIFGTMISPNDAGAASRAGKRSSPSDSFRSVASLRRQIIKKVQASNAAQIKAKQHVQSLLFGLGLGSLVLLIVLFSFFNEVVIAPFIQPSRHVSATPIILSSSDITPNSTPEVIIPKINVEIPVNYSLTTDDENTVENALEGGVVHYASTVMPGQAGNAAFFGHSSNNIFNPGKYKFAFVLLHTLVPGDIFYLTYNGTVYTYKVYDKQVVDPSDIAVLNNVPGKIATATLITCDPPGTSLHRLVVWGEQISPDPSSNVAAAPPATAAATQLASNGPSLWSRLTHWLF